MTTAALYRQTIVLVEVGQAIRMQEELNAERWLFFKITGSFGKGGHKGEGAGGRIGSDFGRSVTMYYVLACTEKSGP